MLTWTLWRALRNPPFADPLFQRVYGAKARSPRLVRALQIGTIYLFICFTAGFIWPLLAVNLAITSLVILIVLNSLVGTVLADRISATIARERELQTYDLLCLLPVGELGIDWSLSTGSLYHSTLFRTTGFLARLLSVGLLGALVIAFTIPLMLLVGRWGGQDVLRLFVVLWYALLMGLGLYMNHIQIVVLAHLIGMLTPAFTTNRLNARMLAAGSLLLFCVGVYLSTAMIGFVILGSVYRWLHVPDPTGVISLPVLRLIIFYGLHEAVIYLIWRLLLRQFNSTPHDTLWSAK